jgi:hypothetical protein
LAKSETGEQKARIAVDKWHLVALANTMITEVRQRVTRDLLGRCGTVADQVWVNRRLLLTGAEHLSTKQWKRLHVMLDSCDPTKQIGAAWGVKERLRLLLGEREPSKIRWRLADSYDAAIDPAMPETTRLAQTRRCSMRNSCWRSRGIQPAQPSHRRRPRWSLPVGACVVGCVFTG